MIFGNISNLDEYKFLEDKFKAAFEYYKAHDLMDYEPGSHEIDGEELFVNIAEYETTTVENRFWEAHKDYIDLQILLAGEEQIDLNFLANMDLGDYVKEDDFQAMNGEKNTSVKLVPGDFLICYPNDAHMTAVMANEPCQVKKAIFKIKL